MSVKEEQAATEQSASFRPTVLLVDDENAVLEGVTDLLELSGYEVLAAENGQKALEIMQSRTPDLIVSDIMMPVMDGYEFYEAVRSNPDWTPIPFIFLTARGQPVDVRRGRALGADEYLVKPFDPEELVIVVNARLSRMQAIRAVTMADVERMKQQLIAIFSHELRTPLAYVYGYVNLLRDERETMSEEDLREMLEGMQRGADRLVQLVEDLMLLVKLDSGIVESELKLRRRDVGLAEVVRRVFDGLRQPARDRGVELCIEVPEELTVTSVPLYLVEAIKRLVHNGIKFAKQGGGCVTIRAWQEDDRVRIDVVDDGIGIHPDDLKTIFSRFHQVDRDELEQQGIGIGLAVARDIVVLMGGDLWAESELGEGSVFHVDLPV